MIGGGDCDGDTTMWVFTNTSLGIWARIVVEWIFTALYDVVAVSLMHRTGRISLEFFRRLLTEQAETSRRKGVRKPSQQAKFIRAVLFCLGYQHDPAIGTRFQNRHMGLPCICERQLATDHRSQRTILKASYDCYVYCPELVLRAIP